MVRTTNNKPSVIANYYINSALHLKGFITECIETKALNELTHNPHTVINKADKGNTIVIEDRTEYIKTQ